MRIVKEGVNRASTFNGFCGEHDTMLFARAEGPDREKRVNGMPTAFHLRAISLEYCRQRRTADFLRKQGELTDDQILKGVSNEHAAAIEAKIAIFKKLYIGSVFAILFGSKIDAITSCRYRFARNLRVSCCGCFAQTNSKFDSVIGFNLISYTDGAFLVFTTFKAVEHYLRNFIALTGPGTAGIEELVNEVAFSKCEEPLIAPTFWEELTEDERRHVGLSLRPPAFRSGLPTPRIIRLGPNDVLEHEEPPVSISFGKDGKGKVLKFKRLPTGEFQVLESEEIQLDYKGEPNKATMLAAIESVRPDLRGRIRFGSNKLAKGEEGIASTESDTRTP